MSFKGNEGTQKELEKRGTGGNDVNSVLQHKILIKTRYGAAHH